MFNFDKNKDNIALITEDSTLSYQDLQKLCDEFISQINNRCLFLSYVQILYHQLQDI